MSFDYHRFDAPEKMSGNASDSDYYSQFNSAKSNRGGQRSSSLPQPRAKSDSNSLSMETITGSKQLSFEEIDKVMKVGRDHI